VTLQLAQFGSLYADEVDRLLGVIACVPSAEYYLRMPVETRATFVGPNALTIDTLVRHLIAAEAHWLSSLPRLAPGAAMTLPAPPVLAEELPRERASSVYRDKVTSHLAGVLAMTDATCREPITFRGKTYNKLAFLSVLLVHHAYHLGQIDLMLRQQDVLCPEHLRF
jgi:uncharacterized damage-inducible protein DinB